MENPFQMQLSSLLEAANTDLRRLDALRSMSSMPCSPRRVKSGPPLLWGAVCRNSYRFLH